MGLIVGPTGAGKTAFALALAERLGAEIVNADSRQLYRRMDLGTAKPSAADRARVPHHLIDVCDPARPTDVAEFAAMAQAAIAGIAARGRPILVVGGSGLYLRVLRGGLFAGPPAAPEYRAELAALAAAYGPPALHRRLQAADPEAARRIGPHDLPRLIRALEVGALSGIPISEHQRRHRLAGGGYENLALALAVPRARLYARIDRRFDAMIAAGLVEEVRALMGMAAGAAVANDPVGTSRAASDAYSTDVSNCADSGPDSNGTGANDGTAAGPRAAAQHAAGAAGLIAQTIGYRELSRYLSGALDLPAAIELAKRESRRLAKRPMTGFRREADLVWLDPENEFEQALAMLSEFFHPA